eukprot:584306-Pyramimonas_sp.AAC.1
MMTMVLTMMVMLMMITVGALKKEPFSLGSSVFLDCVKVCLGFPPGFPWEIEVEPIGKKGPRSLFRVP